MARPKSLVPSYLLHKPTGQARVRLNGKDHYLGPYGSEESRRRYGELIADYAAGKPVDPFVPTGGRDESASLSVSELLLAFLDYAEGHYVKGGKPTDEVHCYRGVIRIVSELYGSMFVDRFGPNELRAVRQAMIDADWSLGYIQRQVNRIRHIFRWGVGRDMVPPAVHQKLCAVEPLQAGRCAARVTRRRGPVSIEHIQAVKAKLRSKTVLALIDLQLFTGARPGELISLCTADIDRSEDVWKATLADHKTSHLGKDRTIHFGPQAQKILAPRLNPEMPQAPLFAIQRTTYAQTVRNACKRAGVPPFVPHELRHTAGTLTRDLYGIDAAQAMLGHSRPDMTAHYTRQTTALAKSVASKAG